MIDFGLVNYQRGNEPLRAGWIREDVVYELSPHIGSSRLVTLAEVYEHWDDVLPALATLEPKDGLAVADVTLLPPSLQPSGIYCAGINYQDHVDAVYRRQNIPPEPSLRDLGLPPWHFLKARNTLRGQGSTIPLFTDHIDWEVELAVVIGRTARNVTVESALDYVAGYTVANDLSARDRVMRAGMAVGSPFRYDWIAQKSFEGSCPLGPWLVPADRIGDPGALDLRLCVNGRVRQNSNTRNMIYTTAEQIAYLSTIITLSPGDVILTGTPAGTGFESNEFLHRGDVVTAEIAEIGELTVTMS